VRAFTLLKAALNRAFYADRVSSDTAWRKVKPFKRVDEAVVRYLNTEEARRLVNACGKDFRKLVPAALLTGCRYAELTRLKCGDFNPDSGTLAIRLSTDMEQVIAFEHRAVSNRQGLRIATSVNQSIVGK
jgi:integrase